MGAFLRDRMPEWPQYVGTIGADLAGRGRWRTTRCDFHNDSEPSLRVNVETGGWVCMACRAKGGDTVSHYMLLTGRDFIGAAQALGAWDDRASYAEIRSKPGALSPRDAMQVVAHEMTLLLIVISDARNGLLPSQGDWDRFIEGVARVQWLAEEFAQ